MTFAALPHPGRFRAGLIALAAVPVIQAIWMLTAPRAFYDGFPGAGRAWLPAVGVYDEHLSRDVGAAQLGLAVVLIGAAVLLERRVVVVALLGVLAASIPHAVYHLTTIGRYATVDNVLSLGAFAAQVALAGWLLLQIRHPRSASWPASRASRPPRAVR